jgi:hypothetical protein
MTRVNVQSEAFEWLVASVPNAVKVLESSGQFVSALAVEKLAQAVYEMPRWRRIEPGAALPPMGHTVMLVVPGVSWAVQGYLDIDGAWRGGLSVALSPTHWMELPPLPEDRRGEGPENTRA